MMIQFALQLYNALIFAEAKSPSASLGQDDSGQENPQATMTTETTSQVMRSPSSFELC